MRHPTAILLVVVLAAGCEARTRDGATSLASGVAAPPDEAVALPPELDALLYCAKDPERQKARSAELLTLMRDDQEARRQRWATKPRQEVRAILEADTRRRARVGAIFGEGCLSSAEDYAAAAAIFQHGYEPEHAYQSFVFARHALEKAPASEAELRAFARRYLASGIDRYLVRTGRRQLFGTQLAAVPGSPCFCLEAVEPSLPEGLRKELSGRSLEEVTRGHDAFQRDPDCETAPCAQELTPSPRGTVPGLW